MSIGRDILVCATHSVASELVVKRTESAGLTIRQYGKSKHPEYEEIILRGVELTKKYFGYSVDGLDIGLYHKIPRAEHFGGKVGVLLAIIYAMCDLGRQGKSKRDIFEICIQHDLPDDSVWHYASALLLGGLRANYSKLRLSQKVYTPASLGLAIVVPKDVEHRDTLMESQPSALAAWLLACTTGNIEDIMSIMKSLHDQGADVSYATLYHGVTNIPILLCPNTGVANDVVARYQDDYLTLSTEINPEGIAAL